MSRLNDNLKVAKDATRWLAQMKIKSTNRPHEFVAWLRRHPGQITKGSASAHETFTFGVDGFILQMMRHENKVTDLVAMGMDQTRAQIIITRRKMVTTIISGTQTPRQKRNAIKQLLQNWNATEGTDWWVWLRTNTYGFGASSTATESQRGEKKLTRYRYGNCGEKSAALFEYLGRNNATQSRILWISCTNWDHAFTVYGAQQAGASVASWGNDAVIVDGWSEDYYSAKHPFRLISGNRPGPWQLWVRKKIAEANPNFQVKQVTNPNTLSTLMQAALDDAMRVDVMGALEDELDDVDELVAEDVREIIADAYMEFGEQSM